MQVIRSFGQFLHGFNLEKHPTHFIWLCQYRGLPPAQSLQSFNNETYDLTTDKMFLLEINSIEFKCKEKFSVDFEATLGVKCQTEVILDTVCIGKYQQLSNGVLKWCEKQRKNLSNNSK